MIIIFLNWNLQGNSNLCYFCFRFEEWNRLYRPKPLKIVLHVLASKICSANRNNFKLSQLGDLILHNQFWKFYPKRLAAAVFTSWSVFFESGSNRPINLFSLIPCVLHFVEGSFLRHTLHLMSSIVLQSFNVMMSILCILQTRTVFRGFGL